MHKRSSVAIFSMLTAICAWAQVDAGPNQEVCGTSATLQANIPGVGESGFWSSPVPGVTFLDSADPLTTVNGLVFGENELMWAYITPAGATTDLVTIWAFDASAPPANAGPDQTIIGPPFTATLSATGCATFPCSCNWVVYTGTATFTDPTDPTATVTGLGVGENVLGWSCNNGPCGATSDVISINAFVWNDVPDDATNEPHAVILSYDPQGQQLRLISDGVVDEIAILDMQGRSLPLATGARSSRSWDMAQHASGLYVVKSVVDGQKYVSRFVVARP